MQRLGVLPWVVGPGGSLKEDVQLRAGEPVAGGVADQRDALVDRPSAKPDALARVG